MCLQSRTKGVLSRPKVFFFFPDRSFSEFFPMTFSFLKRCPPFFKSLPLELIRKHFDCPLFCLDFLSPPDSVSFSSFAIPSDAAFPTFILRDVFVKPYRTSAPFCQASTSPASPLILFIFRLLRPSLKVNSLDKFSRSVFSHFFSPRFLRSPRQSHRFFIWRFETSLCTLLTRVGLSHSIQSLSLIRFVPPFSLLIESTACS